MPLHHGHGHARPPAKPTYPTRFASVEVNGGRALDTNGIYEKEVAQADLIDGGTVDIDQKADEPALEAADFVLTFTGKDIRISFLSAGKEVAAKQFKASELRRLLQDYGLVSDSYYASLRTAPPPRIQQLDMGKRALHDEGGRKVAALMTEGGMKVDHETSRRIFTLIHIHCG